MIGIFDSGVGGLSIFCEIKKLKPNLSLVYLADSANFPYGEKTQAQLVGITRNASKQLLKYGVTTVVVACNSATVSTIDNLRKAFPQVIFVGVEPAIKLAVKDSQDAIGLLATKKTVQTHDADSLAGGIHVYRHHPEELITKIENDFSSIVEGDLRTALKSFIAEDVRMIVLGCTHFYFVKDRFCKMFPNIQFIEPAEAVAARAVELDTDNSEGMSTFLVSGNTHKFGEFLENVVGYKNANIRKI